MTPLARQWILFGYLVYHHKYLIVELTRHVVHYTKPSWIVRCLPCRLSLARARTYLHRVRLAVCGRMSRRTARSRTTSARSGRLFTRREGSRAALSYIKP